MQKISHCPSFHLHLHYDLTSGGQALCDQAGERWWGQCVSGRKEVVLTTSGWAVSERVTMQVVCDQLGEQASY